MAVTAELPLNQVILGDCTEVMKSWQADSIDLVITSPPYWGLRDYGAETVRVWGGDSECEHEWVESKSSLRERHHGEGSKTFFNGVWSPEGMIDRIKEVNKSTQTEPLSSFCIECRAWQGSLGLEPHPQMFVDHLVEICREIKRVLKPSGTFWLNLGDTYFTGAGKSRNPGGDSKRGMDRVQPASSPNRTAFQDGAWLQPKQLLGMPWRIAIALQHEGWILRNDIIWFKPNHMPSSVKDRLTNAYEHVFLFAKARRYYFDLDAIRESYSESSIQRLTQPTIMQQMGGEKQHELYGDAPGHGNRPADILKGLAPAYKGTRKGLKSDYKNYEGKLVVAERSKKLLDNRDKLGKPNHPKGKNPGDVWEIDKPIISNSRKELHGPTYRRHQIKIEGGQAIGLHPLGKNPGDLWEFEEEKLTKHDRAVGRINRIYTDPLHIKEYDLKGKNPGDLWRIPTRPFPGAHFAVFPPALIEPIIKAGSPQWICTKCGKPRKRVVEPTPRYAEKLGKSVHDHKDDLKKGMRYDKVCNAEYVTTGWSDCGCGEGWEPGVVLDPFGGSGTVGQVARRLGRRFILIEIIPEYCKMAEQRVRGRYKPAPEGVPEIYKFLEEGKQ